MGLRPTPFAADSGFAACGDAPRGSKGFGRRRYLVRPAAAAKTNRSAASHGRLKANSGINQNKSGALWLLIFH